MSLSKYLVKKSLCNKAMDAANEDWRKIHELEEELNDLLDIELSECDDLSTMAKLMGWDLSNYEALSNISPKDMASSLEMRVWLLGLNDDALKNDWFCEFGRLNFEQKKTFIKSHIKNPINHDYSTHKKPDPVIKLEPKIKKVSPTDNGAQFDVSFSSNDYSYQDRLFLAINPYASESDIEASIRQIMFDHRKKQKKVFPVHKMAGFEKRKQSLSVAEINEKMVIPALDLFIFLEYGELFSSEFPLPNYGKRKRVVDLVFNAHRRPSIEKVWESFVVSCCSSSFTNWLRAEG